MSITQFCWHDDNISQSINAKRNMKNGLRALKKITSNSRLKIANDQKMACFNEVRSATSGCLYVCARNGFQEYISCLKLAEDLFDDWLAIASINPKHIFRVIFSLGNK